MSFATGDEDSGVRFVRYAHPWIGFIVAQHDIIARLQLLDKRILKDESFDIAVGEQQFDIGDSLDKRAKFSISFAAPIVLEVRTDSIF